MGSNKSVVLGQLGPVLLAALVVMLGLLPGSSILESPRPSSSVPSGAPVAVQSPVARRAAADPIHGLAGWVATKQGRPLEESLGARIHRPGFRATEAIVMITTTEPYAEAEERRRRDRVALHLALWDEGLAAIDPDHVTFAWIDVGGNSDGARATSPPGGCAIEWFCDRSLSTEACGPASGVAVIWIGIDGAPGATLAERLEAIGGALGGNDRITIVGPPYSGDLVAMVHEATCDPRLSGLLKREGVHWFAPGATIPCSELKARGATDAVCALIRRPHTPTDDELLSAIATELGSRVSPLVPDGIRPIVVILHEIDTEYGRALGTLAQQAIDRRHNGGLGPFELKVIPYLRGLDGSSPGGPSATTRGSNSSNRSTGSRDNAEALGSYARNRLGEDPAFGEVRADYIRRLAALLDEQHGYPGQHQIFAIGLLGTDYYDKLMLLQGLRQRFPAAIFFTLELDARMREAEARPWTRNVLVASTGGLEPGMEYRPDSRDRSPLEPNAERPPGSDAVDQQARTNLPQVPVSFRDDAQRATYESIRTSRSLREAPTASSTSTRRSEPPVFEVGRFSFVPLLALSDGSIDSDWLPLASLWVLLSLVAAMLVLVLTLGYVEVTRVVAGSSGAAADAKSPKRGRRDSTQDHRSGGAARVASPSSFRQLREDAKRYWSHNRKALTLWMILAAMTLTVCFLYLRTAPRFEAVSLLGTTRSLLIPPLIFILAAALVAFGCARWAEANSARTLPASKERWNRPDAIASMVAMGPYRLTLLVLAILAAIVAFPTIIAVWSREPLSWLEGVSIAPTMTVRLLGVVVACTTLAYYLGALTTDRERLRREFELDASSGESEPNLRDLWQGFAHRDTIPWVRNQALSCTVIWLLAISVLFLIWPSTTPTRGAPAFAFDLLTTALFVVSATLLNFAIWSRILLCNRFVNRLPFVNSGYTEAVRRRTGFHPELAHALLDMRLIAAVTELPRRLIYVPVILFAFHALARSPLVDNWVLAPSYAVALGLSLALTIHGSAMLRTTAQRARSMELEALRRDRGSARAPGSGTYSPDEVDKVIKAVEDYKEGPFESLFREPAAQAVAITLIPVALAWISGMLTS